MRQRLKPGSGHDGQPDPENGARLLLSLMLLFSFFILLRGHNEPGGGFIGG